MLYIPGRGTLAYHILTISVQYNNRLTCSIDICTRQRMG